LGTPATTKTQGKGRRNPKLSVRERVPYVGIGVWLTAVRANSVVGCLRSCVEGGITLLCKIGDYVRRLGWQAQSLLVASLLV